MQASYEYRDSRNGKKLEKRIFTQVKELGNEKLVIYLVSEQQSILRNRSNVTA